MSEHIDNTAHAIVNAGNVQEGSATEYIVNSTDSGKLYGVEIGAESIYKCLCPAGEHKGYCSHIEAVKLSRGNKIQ